MNGKINAIYGKIKELEEELEVEFTKASERFHYHIEARKARFEESVLEFHRKTRKSVYRFVREASFWNVMTAPVIYGMAVPIAVLDLTVTLYQSICFPAYGVKKVPRSDFVVIDRGSLEYLNVIERFHCAYCGYANGVAAYFREVAARTEEYWCPIKHARKIRNPHSRYHKFADYGDAEEYREKVNGSRTDKNTKG